MGTDGEGSEGMGEPLCGTERGYSGREACAQRGVRDGETKEGEGASDEERAVGLGGGGGGEGGTGAGDCEEVDDEDGRIEYTLGCLGSKPPHVNVLESRSD